MARAARLAAEYLQGLQPVLSIHRQRVEGPGGIREAGVPTLGRHLHGVPRITEKDLKNAKAAGLSRWVAAADKCRPCATPAVASWGRSGRPRGPLEDVAGRALDQPRRQLQ